MNPPSTPPSATGGGRATRSYRIRRRLLAAHDCLGARGFDRMLVLLEAGDPTGEVAAAYLAKELLREVDATTDIAVAHHRLGRFYDHCRSAEVRERTRLALTNGPTEAVNLLVKKVKRVGHGFRNFENYRLYLLLHCGVQWQTRPTASIRARHPRLVA